MTLAGRVAVVTGAASGLGLAIATAAAHGGADVVMADVDDAAAVREAERIADEYGAAWAVAVDVREERSVEELVRAVIDRYGRVDALFNVAAATTLALAERSLLDASCDEWDTTFAVNVRGPMLCCKHVLPHMLASGHGVIINVSSVASLAGDTFSFAYAASKGALNVLTQYVATTFGRRGIRCVAVLPALTLSDAARELLPSEMLETWEANTPASGLACPADIADVAIFLASDGARMINGALIRVDGGFSSHQPTSVIG